MEYSGALVTILVCLIPFLFGAGFGLDALLKHCSEDSDCKSDEMCMNNKCVYACKDKGCPKGAMCYANDHTFSCICPGGYGISPNDTMKICRKWCYDDSECTLTESCELGLCVDACSGYDCDNNTISLAYDHKCTCECLPGFRPTFNKKCKRIPKCSEDYDCHYSEKCEKKKCVGVCRNAECSPRQICIAYNHSSVCVNTTQTLKSLLLEVETRGWSVVSPLSQEILRIVLAASTSGGTLKRISHTLHRESTYFDINPRFSLVIPHTRPLVEHLHKIGPNLGKIYLRGDANLKIRDTAERIGFAVGDDPEPTSKALRLRQILDFTIDPGRLLTECTVIDENSQTMKLTGGFATGHLIETDVEFVVIPFKPSSTRTADHSIIYLYNKNPESRLNSTIAQKLFELPPHVFFPDPLVEKKMGIVVPSGMAAHTIVDVGEQLLKNSLNIMEASFITTDGGHIEYQSNEYEILQNITLKMGITASSACAASAATEVLDVEFLNTKDFAMFVVSKEQAFFYAFYG